jgi:hypothetical protein
MAQIIKLKRSLVEGSKPTTSDLSAGELAINVYDGKVFLRKSGSVDEVQEVITNDYIGSINVDGAITASFFKGDGSRLTNITVDQAATIKSSFTDSSTWVVNHNLDTDTPLVQVYDADDYQIIPQTLRITDTNTVTITFETAESGHVVVGKGGHVVSGSIAAENIDGFDNLVKTRLDAEAVVSGSTQFLGDVTGTPFATVIASVDGGDI